MEEKREMEMNESEEKEKDNFESDLDSKDSAEENIEDPQKLEDEEFEGIEEDDDLALKLKLENSKLAEENRKLENELNSLRDRLARTAAEYENYRKRTAKEKEGIYTDACADVLKGILPVLDNLERAMLVEGNGEDIKKGIEMTIRQFNGSLEKLEVEEIGSEGEFDPNFHNAVMHIDDPQFGKNQVVEVFQKGYKRGDKVLRYSMVKVAN